MIIILLSSCYGQKKYLKLELTKDKPSVIFEVDREVMQQICFIEYDKFHWQSIFDTILIQVDTNIELPWHTSIRGISTDDFRNHIERLIYQVFGEQQEKQAAEQRKLKIEYNFVRDVLSSCPSPLFATNRSFICHVIFTFWTGLCGDTCANIS